MLKYRLISGCLMAAALVLGANYMPAVGIWLLLLAVSAVGQWEFYSMLRMAGIPSFRVVGVICGTALISATYWTIGRDPARLANCYQWENIVLMATLIAVFVRQFPQKHNDKPLETIGCTLLGIWYVPYLLNFFTRLIFSWDPSMGQGVGTTGRMLLLYLVVIVKISDVGAYFTGTLIGRHKLFPRISPGKTWEGFFGGMAVATVASILFYLFTDGRFGLILMRRMDAVFLGVLLSVVGVVGDLFESLLKRASGMKDSGRAIPGMGGALDVIDSLLFGAPILYAYARFILP